jgi:hypothetical protein
VNIPPHDVSIISLRVGSKPTGSWSRGEKRLDKALHVGEEAAVADGM